MDGWRSGLFGSGGHVKDYRQTDRQPDQNKQLLEEVVRRSAELFSRDWVEQARFYDNNNKDDDDDGEELLQSPLHAANISIWQTLRTVRIHVQVINNQFIIISIVFFFFFLSWNRRMMGREDVIDHRCSNRTDCSWSLRLFTNNFDMAGNRALEEICKGTTRDKAVLKVIHPLAWLLTLWSIFLSTKSLWGGKLIMHIKCNNYNSPGSCRNNWRYLLQSWMWMVCNARIAIEKKKLFKISNLTWTRG